LGNARAQNQRKMEQGYSGEVRSTGSVRMMKPGRRRKHL